MHDGELPDGPPPTPLEALSYTALMLRGLRSLARAARRPGLDAALLAAEFAATDAMAALGQPPKAAPDEAT